MDPLIRGDRCWNFSKAKDQMFCPHQHPEAPLVPPLKLMTSVAPASNCTFATCSARVPYEDMNS